MCLGSSPSAPQVVYQGPSDSDIKRSEDSLNQYRTQMGQQQQQFQSQLQSQISSANQETAALQAQYDKDYAGMNDANAAANAKTAAGYDAANANTAAGYATDSSSAAALAAAEMASYTTSATQTEVPEGAQTTAASTAKKKPKKNLKISTAGTANQAGSGLNIGV
tara:strand:+ start:305 stop:799 length:495 start_codon:yes stop_codon:yes gene_type:complete